MAEVRPRSECHRGGVSRGAFLEAAVRGKRELGALLSPSLPPGPCPVPRA